MHSEYSLMESTIKIKALVAAASKNNMGAVALTDKYMMSGAIEFYREAVISNIKPIIGCEICVTAGRIPYHLVLLAKDIRGYENLCQIVSKSHLGSKNQVPAVRFSYLWGKSRGLIALSGCMSGEIPALLKEGKAKQALARAKDYLELFDGDFFLEIQRYPSSRNMLSGSSLSQILINFSAKSRIRMVATNNVHYLSRDDYMIYKYLSKIKTMGTKSDPAARLIKNNEHYFKSTPEMDRMFADIPGAIHNTRIVADKCNLKLPLNRTILPRFKVPGGETQQNYLKKLCEHGVKWRYGTDPGQEVCRRLDKELKIIMKTGYCGYFLIVADMAKFVRNNNIPICGKGSAAGSLVSYVLGIADVDPIKNNLYFERFLNEERKEPPDIDIDLCSKRKPEVLKYLASKYGKDNISRVCTFSTLKPRAALRETGRLLNLNKSEIDHIIKAVPGFRRFHGPKNIKDGTKGSPGADIKNSPYRKILSISSKIESFIRHFSMHPSAFMVSDSRLAKKVPLILSETGEIMSQYDKDSIKTLGLIKIDLINSLSLTLISEVTDTLRSSRNIRLAWQKMKYDDKKTFDLLKKGKTLGVFQLESSGIRTLMKKIGPQDLNDITLLISLYRPGPQQSGMVKNFIERKFGREKVAYFHPDLEPILGETYGVILYQEQVMQLALRVAGYSLSEADVLRKAITRLSGKAMESQQARFIKGALRQGYHIKVAREIFSLISKFASYGFVKAHAAAYAELSYKTCYIKAHYPAELLSTILTNNSGYYGSARYIEEARRLNLGIKLPDINRSMLGFTVEDVGTSIRAPISAVKGLGAVGASSVIDERRKNGDFKDLTDFYYRASKNCRVTKNAVENLIKVGAFDYTGSGRKYLLLAFSHLKSTGPGSGGLPHQDKKDFTLEEKLELEEKILGFCVSYSPLEYFRDEFKELKVVRSRCFPVLANSKRPAGTGNIFTAGMVITRRIEKTRDGKNMLFCTLEDEDGMYESVFFPDAYRRNTRTIMNESVIIIEGRLHFKDENISVIGRNVISPLFLKKKKSDIKKADIKNDILARVSSIWEN